MFVSDREFALAIGLSGVVLWELIPIVRGSIEFSRCGGLKLPVLS